MKIAYEQLQRRKLEYDAHRKRLEELITALSPFSEKIPDEYRTLSKLPETFSRKIEDFYREKRKLRIGVMGQVKAGKSSFLNALLFEGKEVLPKAPTPKTANLAIMQYDETNRMEVEFYEEKEWEELRRLSLLDAETDEVKVAKQTMEMLNNHSINPYDYIGKPPFIVSVQSFNELLGKINDYAGENGRYTPLVKSLQLYIHDERLKDIEIIDTPGMNDPVVARTDKTRQVMEFTDAVFFLSQASSFLDKTDMNLFVRQLPERGIKNLILLASKYDSGILDAGWDMESLEETEIDIKTRLVTTAKRTFNSWLDQQEKLNPNRRIREVVEKSLPPLFVSSMAHNLLIKPKQDYSKEESHVLQELNALWPGYEFSDADLERISHFQEVKARFAQVVQEKDRTLADKGRDFIPTSIVEVTNLMEQIRAKAESRLVMLQKDGIHDLEGQRRAVQARKFTIKSGIENILGMCAEKLERYKLETLALMRKDSRDYAAINERTGTETKERTYQVSSSTWYKPWTWGSYETRRESYEVSYRYLDISDAIENVRNFVMDAATSIESLFNKAIDVRAIRKELIAIILENFNTDDESFSPEFYKLIAERCINQIEFPIIQIHIESEIRSLASNFSGEIRSATAMSDLRSSLSQTLVQVFGILENRLAAEVTQFKSKLIEMKSLISNEFLQSFEQELTMLMAELQNKEEEAATYDKIIAVVKERISKVS